MEQRGIATERGNMNRTIMAINKKIKQFWNEIVQLKDKLKNVVTPTAKPTFYAALQSIVENGNLHQNYGKARNIKMAMRFRQLEILLDFYLLREELCVIMNLITRMQRNTEHFIIGLLRIQEIYVPPAGIYLRKGSGQHCKTI
jgi:hypothetical protein